MYLYQAFEIHRKEVVSFVGGGGKTTAMFALAAELVEEGRRVVTTTTTRIFSAQIALAPVHITFQSTEQVLSDVAGALRAHRHVLVIGPPGEGGKAPGVDPSLIDRLIELDPVDVVLNEADGSRMRPFKAPGEHEPPIPTSTTLLVPVVGVDAVNTPLDDEFVHRADRAAALAGVPRGAVVDPQIIARVITHPDGGLKNRPEAARVIPLVNKAANVAQLLVARDIAGQLLRSPSIDAVAIGAVKNAAMPVAELHRRVAAVVLAAGGSTRMGSELKQLLPWGGSTLVRHTVEVLLRTELADVVVVVGRRAEDVAAALQGTGARLATNRAWNEGRSTSVRAGIDALGESTAAAIFVNADQPFLTAPVIDTLLQRYFQTLAPVVVPLYDGEPGSPVLFDRLLFGELRRLEGESGGKYLLDAHRDELEEVNILNTRAAIDVDTREDYEAALAEAHANPPEAITSTVSHGEK
ncbi:MAG: selenium cofactor biosynthesis protein YqeC [Rudaea sp.]